MMTVAEFVLARVAEDERDTAPMVDRMLTNIGHAALAGFASRLFGEWRHLAATDPDPNSLALRHIATVYAGHPDYRAEWSLNPTGHGSDCATVMHESTRACDCGRA